ncbi:MAG: amino acid permease, partial [Armatimonadota bacterium]
MAEVAAVGYEPEVRLSREMSLFAVTMIGVGAMIGAGIFALLGLAAAKAGPALMIAFVLNGVVALITGMGYGELGACFPHAGGEYLWGKQGLPGGAGFLMGWLSWFGHSLACSLYALAFGSYFHEMLVALGLPELPWGAALTEKGLAVVVCIVFGWINYRGAAETGRAGAVVTVGKVIVLAGFIALGFVVLQRNPDWKANFSHFVGPNDNAFAILTAMGMTYIAFQGYEIIAQSGEEVVNPKRNVPLAIFLSLIVVVPIYLLVAFVAFGATTVPEGWRPPDEFAQSALGPNGTYLPWQYLGSEGELAVLEAARGFHVLGGVIILLGGLLSTVSALNATIYSSSRVSFAMGRENDLPSILGAVHRRRRTPHWAILVSTGLMILMAVALPIQSVAFAANVMFLALFAMVNLMVITMRYRRPDLDRGFKVPLFPYLSVFGIISQVLLSVYVMATSPLAGPVAIAWGLIGVVVYYTYARKREREKIVSEVLWAERIPGERRYTIVVPLANPEHVKPLMTLASAIAKSKGGRIVATTIVRLPPTLPMSEGRRYTRRARRLLEEAESIARARKAEVAAVVRVGRTIWRSILDTIEEENADLVVMGWRGYTRSERRVLGNTLDPIIRHAPCDVAVLKPARDMDELARILVGTTASIHSELGIEFAQAIAEELDLPIDYLHVVKAGTPMDPRTRRRFFEGENGRPPARSDVPLRVVEARSTAREVIDQAREDDLVVVGAAREGILRQLMFGTKAQMVAKLARASVLMVKKYEGPVRQAFRGLLERAEMPQHERDS